MKSIPKAGLSNWYSSQLVWMSFANELFDLELREV